MDRHEAHSLLVAAAREAGAIALRHFRAGGVETVLKADLSPVTAADLAVGAYLSQRLRSCDPDIGWLSEEDADAGERLGRRQVWIVDPIDGTRSFVAGEDEWTISIALVEDGRPIAAALFRPATGDLYDAVAASGSRSNGVRLSVPDGGLDEVARFTGARALLDGLAAELPRALWLRSSRSLALRIALLAEGRIDVAHVKPGARDWDLAAADLILQEAGGRLTTFAGEAPAYNRPDVRQPALIAAGPRRHAALLSFLRRGEDAGTP